MDHSGIAPFAHLPIPPTQYQDIDHVRTATMKDTPPAIPPKMDGAHNAGFDNNNNTKGILLVTIDCVYIFNECYFFPLPIDSFL